MMWHSWGRLGTLRVIPSFSGIGSVSYFKSVAVEVPEAGFRWLTWLSW